MKEEKRNQVSFDDYVETYTKEIQHSIDFIGQDVDFFIELKAKLIVNMAREHFGSLENIRVLDVGSGIGLTDSYLSKDIKNLHGVDVEEGVVKKARAKNPDVSYGLYDGSKLPFDNDIMDMVFTINVMHHIPPENWEVFLGELSRVVKKGGLVAVFEHNPVNPLTRLAVSRCEFDRDAVLIRKKYMKRLFESHNLKLLKRSYIVFFPLRGSIMRKIEKTLWWLPLGAQYCIAGIKQ